MVNLESFAIAYTRFNNGVMLAVTDPLSHIGLYLASRTGHFLLVCSHGCPRAVPERTTYTRQPADECRVI